MTDLQQRARIIAVIKEVFVEMSSSRRRLKPILTEIVKALDNNLFVDADSDEVKHLLDMIVEMQSHFGEIEELRSAAASRNVEKLEHAIQNMEIKNSVNEMREVLIRFRDDLVCRSENISELDAARKLQNQAKKLLLKADKMNTDEFIAESRKFESIAEKIDDPSTISPESFLELQEAFPDNKLIGFLLLSKSLTLKAAVPSPIEKPLPPSEPVQLKDINKLLKQCGGSIEKIQLNEFEFIFDSAELKKQLTFKSFNNKVRTLAERNESEFFPVLRSFINTRVLSATENFKGFNYTPLVPTIGEKLFQWGAVDKVHWHSLVLYCLNDNGWELLSKMFPPKDGKSNPKKPVHRHVSQFIRRFIFMSAFCELGIEKKNWHLDGDPMRFWIQTRNKSEGGR